MTFKHLIADGITIALARFLAILLLLTGPASFAAQPGDSRLTLIAAEALLNEGESQQAWDLLSPLQTELAGQVEYDYLLGTAALDSGRASEAVFALQRVLRNAPDFAGARMELARAYYELEDYALAEVEFNKLKALPPPEAVEQVIDQYLAAIHKLDDRYKTVKRAFVEAELGMNTNANGATSISQFLTFLLDEKSREQRSAYYGIRAGGNISHPLSARWRLRSYIDLHHREYPAVSEIDTNQAATGLWLENESGDTTTRFGASGHYVQLNNQTNNYGAALDFGINQQLGDHWKLTGNARAGALRFASQFNSRDTNQLLMSLGAEHEFLNQRNMTLGLGLVGGREVAQNPDDSGEKTATRTIYGLQTVLGGQLNSATHGALSLGLLKSDYRSPFFSNVTAGAKRDDRQYSAEASLTWPNLPVLPGWTLRNRWRFVRNQSSIDLFEYRGLDVGLALRKSF